MFLSAVTILCLFCTWTSAASISSGTCIVPESQQSLVTGLEKQLVGYANLLSFPEPSVLIALNLAENQDMAARKLLLQQVKDTAAKEMTSGKVALYVLALRSSCENPTDVITPENKVNLVNVLEEKTKEEIDYYYSYDAPKTTYYQLALDCLALCVENSPDVEMAAIILAKAGLSNGFQSAGHFSVDTAAVASLALACVYDGMIATQQTKLVGTIQDDLGHLTKQILGEQKSSGIIGNIYSTGLAMQALSVTSEFYLSGAWSCTKTLNKMLDEVYLGAFNTPGAASQILPSLVGKTYLDVKGFVCSPEDVPTIAVQYTISNDRVGTYFTFSITVEVPKGSILLAVLEAAQSAEPSKFSFQTEQTSWGPMIVSINGVQANNNEKTYWEFFSGKTPLDQGVGSYKPTDKEHILAIFNTY